MGAYVELMIAFASAAAESGKLGYMLLLSMTTSGDVCSSCDNNICKLTHKR